MPLLSSVSLRVALVFGLMSIAAGAYAIVSDRHLKGVSALDCDLESSPSEFRLWVSTRDRTLRLDDDPTRIPYRDMSDTVLQFRFAPPGAGELACDLELPAGALTCVDAAGVADIGFCILVH